MNLTELQLQAIVTALSDPANANINACLIAIHGETADDVANKIYSKSYALSCLPFGIYRTRLENKLKLRYIKRLYRQWLDDLTANENNWHEVPKILQATFHLAQLMVAPKKYSRKIVSKYMPLLLQAIQYKYPASKNDMQEIKLIADYMSKMYSLPTDQADAYIYILEVISNNQQTNYICSALASIIQTLSQASSGHEKLTVNHRKIILSYIFSISDNILLAKFIGSYRKMLHEILSDQKISAADQYRNIYQEMAMIKILLQQFNKQLPESTIEDLKSFLYDILSSLQKEADVFYKQHSVEAMAINISVISTLNMQEIEQFIAYYEQNTKFYKDRNDDFTLLLANNLFESQNLTFSISNKNSDAIQVSQNIAAYRLETLSRGGDRYNQISQAQLISGLITVKTTLGYVREVISTRWQKPTKKNITFAPPETNVIPHAFMIKPGAKFDTEGLVLTAQLTGTDGKSISTTYKAKTPCVPVAPKNVLLLAEDDKITIVLDEIFPKLSGRIKNIDPDINPYFKIISNRRGQIELALNRKAISEMEESGIDDTTIETLHINLELVDDKNRTTKFCLTVKKSDIQDGGEIPAEFYFVIPREEIASEFSVTDLQLTVNDAERPIIIKLEQMLKTAKDNATKITTGIIKEDNLDIYMLIDFAHEYIIRAEQAHNLTQNNTDAISMAAALQEYHTLHQTVIKLLAEIKKIISQSELRFLELGPIASPNIALLEKANSTLLKDAIAITIHEQQSLHDTIKLIQNTSSINFPNAATATHIRKLN